MTKSVKHFKIKTNKKGNQFGCLFYLFLSSAFGFLPYALSFFYYKSIAFHNQVSQ